MSKSPFIEHMPTATVDASGVADIASKKFSFLSLFFESDILVQTVIVLLLLASFWSWTVIFGKWMKFKYLHARARKFEAAFWSGKSLEEIYERLGKRPRDPFSYVFNAAMNEWEKSYKKRGAKGGDIVPRIDRIMQVTAEREVQLVQTHLSTLATIGAICPFIGLFGTVWGIMNSLQSIGLEKSTNLAVVAPGIAEALFATALGLMAAIPASIAYNKFASELNKYCSRLDFFVGELGNVVSRTLER